MDVGEARDSVEDRGAVRARSSWPPSRPTCARRVPAGRSSRSPRAPSNSGQYDDSSTYSPVRDDRLGRDRAVPVPGPHAREVVAREDASPACRPFVEQRRALVHRVREEAVGEEPEVGRRKADEEHEEEARRDEQRAREAVRLHSRDYHPLERSPCLAAGAQCVSSRSEDRLLGPGRVRARRAPPGPCVGAEARLRRRLRPSSRSSLRLDTDCAPPLGLFSLRSNRHFALQARRPAGGLRSPRARQSRSSGIIIFVWGHIRKQGSGSFSGPQTTPLRGA